MLFVFWKLWGGLLGVADTPLRMKKTVDFVSVSEGLAFQKSSERENGYEREHEAETIDFDPKPGFRSPKSMMCTICSNKWSSESKVWASKSWI